MHLKEKTRNETTIKNINEIIIQQKFLNTFVLPEYTKENYITYVKTLQNMMEDMYMRYIYYSQGWTYMRRDVPKINVSTGIVYTPDYKLMKEGLTLWIEVKFKMGLWTEEMKNAVILGKGNKVGTREKYGDEVKLVFLSGDSNYIKRIFDKQFTYRRALDSLLDLINKLRPIVPNHWINYKTGQNNLGLFDDILKKTSNFFSNNTENKPTLNTDEKQDSFTDDIINNLENMYPFMQENVLMSEDMMDNFQEDIGGNIDPDNPWNRDKSLEFSKENDRHHNHGNKAKNLKFCPDFIPNETISLDELQEVVKENANDVFKAAYFYFYINKQCSNEIEILNTLIQLNAFLEGGASEKSVKEISLNFFGEELGRGLLIKRLMLKKGLIEVMIKDSINENIGNLGVEDLKISISKRKAIIFESEKLFNKSFAYRLNRDEENKERDKISAELNAYMKKFYKGELTDMSKIAHDAKINELTQKLSKFIKDPAFRSKLDYVDAFKNFEDEEELLKVSDLRPKFEDLTDAYSQVGNDNLNNLANETLKISEEMLEKVMDNKFARMTYSHHKLLETIKGNVGKPDGKYTSNKSFIIFQCPHTKVYTISTPSPSPRISGTMLHFGKVHKDFKFEVTRPWIHSIEFIEKDDYIYWFSSKPFKLPWITVKSGLKMKWGSIFLAAYSLEIESNLYEKSLYWSLFWNFSRSVKFCLDLIYLVMKSSYQLGSFGKSKITEEINGLVTNDVRCSSLLFRLSKNFKKFASEQFKTSLSKYNQLNYSIDPIFGTKLTGWSASLLITYLKSIYGKEDDADPISIEGTFIQKEIDLAADYSVSVFNRKITPMDTIISFSEFMKKLFPNGFANNWVKLAYYAPAIEKYAKILAESAKEEYTKAAIRSPVS